MGKSNLNPWLMDVRGRYGNLVFRKQRGKVIIARRNTNPLPEPTEAQRNVRRRFKLAAGYAKDVLADAARRAFYEAVAEAKDQPVFSVILTDYLKPPVIESIRASGYQGRVGDKIVVEATDDVEVVSVDVRLRLADGTLLEGGAAVLAGGLWTYVATAALPTGQSATIEVVAKDRPGNEGTKTVNYP